VQYDSGLYVGAALHTDKLEKVNLIFHSLPPALRGVGNAKTYDPVKIAKYLLEEFENSE
jgi:hypothetical protein